MDVLQKKLIRIVTCSPYRAHSKPLLVANKVLSVHEMTVYIVGIFMYKYCNNGVPDILNDFFQKNSELHNRNTRQSNDLHVRFARLDVRKFSLKIHGATICISSLRVLWMYLSKCVENISLIWICMGLWHSSNRSDWWSIGCIDDSQKNTVCKSLSWATLSQLYRFGTLCCTHGYRTVR